MSQICYFIVTLIFTAVYSSSNTIIRPEQIHISYGAVPSEMVITWITWNSTNESYVSFSPVPNSEASKPLDTSFVYNFGARANAIQSVYIDGGAAHRVYYVHRATLAGLSPSTKYVYACGMVGAWSDIYAFTTTPAGTNWSPRIAIYGDMGVKNIHALSFVAEEAEMGRIDSVLHIGDIAYDMNDDESRRGDFFFNMLQPLAATTPYMLAAGNHEQAYNFSCYRRFVTMPSAGGDGEGGFYSYNVGPVHIVVTNTEYYYFVNYGWRQIQRQYEWLEADLAEANKPANRALRPWIILVGHRPMYCSSNNDPEHCEAVNNYARVGIPYREAYLFAPEELYYEAGVDLMFFGHEHNYERFWPVYNRRVCNGSDPSNPYVNPRAPIHFTTGAAGNQEYQDPFLANPWPWSAYHSDDYSYSRITVFNATHLYFEQYSVEQMGVIDSAWIIKNRHGAGTYSCQ